jgi:hypothetical protein
MAQAGECAGKGPALTLMASRRSVISWEDPGEGLWAWAVVEPVVGVDAAAWEWG